MTRATFFKHFELLADQPDAVVKMRKLVLQMAVQARLGDGAVVPGSAKQKLGAVIELISGQHLIPGEYNKDRKGIPYLTGPADFGPKFPTASRWTETPKVVARKGDVLLTVKGAGVGKTNVVKDDKLAISRQLMAVRSKTVDSGFIDLSLRAAFDDFQAASNGIAIPGISREDVLNYEAWIPSLAEQRRIVAKVDELMALCDELEQRQQARQHASGLLQQSALHHLLAAREPQSFAAAWQRVRDHFHLLHDTPDAIPQLRQAILQFAVQGRLVPSQAKRTFGSLESILAEASANGVSKGPTTDNSATEILRISAGTSRKDFYVDEDDFKHVDLLPEWIEKYRLQPDDLLGCRFNGNLHFVGRFSLYRGQSGRVQVNSDKLIRFRINSKLHYPRYVCFVMNSPITREAIEAMCATTAGNIGLSAGKLKTVEIPLPPLAEQKRIVARVEELLRWCDTLEAQLHQTRTLGGHLLNSTLHHLLAA